MTKRSARPGRWRSGEESRRRVLEAARAAFGRHGYDRTTIRAVAAQARVDPAMVHYFFGTKARLFSAAMTIGVDVPRHIAQQIDQGVDGLGGRLVVHFLDLWDERDGFDPFSALIRSAGTDSRWESMFRRFVEQEILARLRTVIEGDDAGLRAELIGSHLIGLAFARYVVRIEPIASASSATVAARMGPVLQHYLSGAPVPAGEPARGHTLQPEEGR